MAVEKDQDIGLYIYMPDCEALEVSNKELLNE